LNHENWADAASLTLVGALACGPPVSDEADGPDDSAVWLALLGGGHDRLARAD